MSSPEIGLLPCPFCGGEPEFVRHGSPCQSSIVACQDCGARVETGETWNEGQLWNRRLGVAQEQPLGDCTQAEIDAWIETIDSKNHRLLLMWKERADKAEAALAAQQQDDYVLRLSPEAHVKFLEALDNPPKANEALKALMRGTSAQEHAEPIAWTNEAQLGFLKVALYGEIPMAMWAKQSASSPIPLYAAPVASTQRHEAIEELLADLWLHFHSTEDRILKKMVERAKAFLPSDEPVPHTNRPETRKSLVAGSLPDATIEALKEARMTYADKPVYCTVDGAEWCEEKPVSSRCSWCPVTLQDRTGGKS
jgi:Lar family restriction alleviation protein